MASILVIEDDAELCVAVAEALKRDGHQVATARNGALGLRAFVADPFELVLVDMVMPEMEGGSTIRALLRDFPGLGIIAMSGSFNYAERWLRLAQHFGACRTLKKPFRLEVLLDTVREVLAARPDPLAEPATVR